MKYFLYLISLLFIPISTFADDFDDLFKEDTVVKKVKPKLKPDIP